MNHIHVCSCGRVFTAAQWSDLEYLGVTDYEWGESLEYRNCTCGSTRCVVVVPEPQAVAA